MREPVVVQGTITNPWDGETIEMGNGNNSIPPPKGEKQETRCRDFWAAILLYINVAAIAAIAGTLGQTAFGNIKNSDTSGIDFTGYANATAVTGVVSLVFAGLSFLVLLAIPQFIIKFSLFFSIGGQVAIAAACIYYQVWTAAGLAVVFLLVTLCYVKAIWSRIPFATVRSFVFMLGA